MAHALRQAPFPDAVIGAVRLSLLTAQQIQHFPARQQVIRALLALGVRILGGAKRAFRAAHLLQQIGKRALRHAAEHHAARRLPGLAVHARQQRAVAQQLFIMRRAPGAVGGIAHKAAAHMVPDAALAQPHQRAFRHPPRARVPGSPPLPEQKKERGRHGKLGRGAEAAVFGVVGGFQRVDRPRAQRRAGRLRGHALLKLGAHGAAQLRARADEPVVTPLPARVRSLQQGQEGLARQIRRHVKRLARRRQQRVERPSARAVHGHARGHVYRVHVGPLLAVHTDGHEVRVEQRGDLRVLKRFPLHHMAPVAAGEPDVQEHQLFFPPRPFKRRIAPGHPRNCILRHACFLLSLTGPKATAACLPRDWKQAAPARSGRRRGLRAPRPCPPRPSAPG